MKPFLALLCFGLTSCATQTKIEKPLSLISEEKITYPGFFPVTRFHFKNGLKLLVVEDHSSPTLAYFTSYQVGSRNEEPGKTGLAHFFEHMMFHQTKTMMPGEADRILDIAGAEGRNALTSHDLTLYVQEVPVSRLDLVARIEADRMENLTFDQKAFDTEREIIHNERTVTEETSPGSILIDELFSLAFKTHPYHWPVIGYSSDLKKLSRKDAFQFYQRHYAPNRAVITVSGDVFPEKVAQTIEKYYAHIPPRLETILPPEPEPLPNRPRQKTVKLHLQSEKIVVGYPVPEMTHSDMPALSVLQTLLLNGRSSRIYKALVNSGIASDLDTLELGEKDPSLFIVGIDLQPKQPYEVALRGLRKEFKAVQDHLVSERELLKAKNQLQFQFFHSIESNNKKAWILGQYETNTGNFKNGLTFQKLQQQVTREEIQDMARKYLNLRHEITVRGVPR